MTHYDEVRAELRESPRTWLITGVAGFIGSNLLETLLKLDQRAVGLDNFATGFRRISMKSRAWSVRLNGKISASSKGISAASTIAGARARASITSCTRRRSAPCRAA